MGSDLRHQMRTNLDRMPTEDLLLIWCGNDRYEWSEIAFEVIREILLERHVQLPSQESPVYREHEVGFAEALARDHNTAPNLATAGLPPVTAEPQSVLSKPKAVVYAVYLGMSVLATRVLQLAVSAAMGQFGTLVGLLAAGSVVLVAFEAWLIRGVWLGSNQRRIVYIGWILLSMITVLINGGWGPSLAEQPIRAAILMLASVLELISVLLLLLPATNAWYQHTSKAGLSSKPSTLRTGRQASRKVTLPSWLWVLTPDAWIKSYTPRIAWILFGVSLLMCWLIFNVALKVQKVSAPGEFIETYFNALYGMFCLPVQAIVLALAALLAQAGKATVESRWRGTVWALWFIGAVLVLLTLVAARTLPYTGS